MSPLGGVAPAGYCRGVSSLDWDSAKRQLRRAAEIKPGAAVADRLKAGGRAALDATAERTAQVMAAAQALLASDLSSDLNNLVAAAVKGSATIYDKAMDANYLDPLLRPGLGGSYHRLFDGGHTIAGAVQSRSGRIPRRHHHRGGAGNRPGAAQRRRHPQRPAARDLGQEHLRRGGGLPGVDVRNTQALVL